MNNQTPYNFAGVARYQPGCLLDAPARFFAATNTGGIPTAPLSFPGNSIPFNAGDVVDVLFKNALGYVNGSGYVVPASGFVPNDFNVFLVYALAGAVSFSSAGTVWGTASPVLVQAVDLGAYAGQTAPVLTLANRTTNTVFNFTMNAGAEKRIYPGRIVLRDYATDDNSFSGSSGSSAYGARGFLHTVKRPESAVVDPNVLAYAGVSGLPSMHQSYNRNGVNGTGMFDSLPVYHRALILMDTAPGNTFIANDSSYPSLFMDTAPGYEGCVTNVTSATTVALDPSQFTLVATRGYGSAVVVQVNTI